jgi:N-acyl homoserine lactone hydrolase
LIETNQGRRILIDTGFPSQAIGTEVFPGFILNANNHVTHQLALIGLTPADIDTLICTHFNFDHAGAHNLFTGAELVVQRAQYAASHDGVSTRYDKYRQYWDHPALRYRQVDGDTTLVSGVELIDTSGHAPGHQSVLVRLPKTGPVLLAIDAAPSATQFDPATYQPNPYDSDPAGALASLQKMRDLITRERVKLTICGHDGRGWALLRKAPEWYE